MIIDKNKLKLKNILISLPDSYIEELASLIDISPSFQKEETIEKILSSLKNPIKLKNYFQTLNDFEKKIISEIIYNSNGKYQENHIKAKYGKIPSFTRKSLLFSNNSQPSYFALFVYHKALIPYDLIEILKQFVPKPDNNTNQTLPETTSKNNNAYPYVYLYSLANLLSINEKKKIFSLSSQNLFSNEAETENFLNITFLMLNTEILENQNGKIKISSQISLDNLLQTILNKIYDPKTAANDYTEKNNTLFFNEIKKIRKTLIKKTYKIPTNTFIDINETYKIFEKEFKKIKLTKKEIINDLNTIFKYLGNLGMINIWNYDNPILYLDSKSPLLTENYETPLNKEIMVLDNRDIISFNEISKKNLNLIELFCDLSGKNIKINEKKLLKLLNRGFNLEIFYQYLKKISMKELPLNFKNYLNDLEKNKVKINTKIQEISANNLLYDMLIYNKNLKGYVKKSENNKIIYEKTYENKIINFITNEGYYIVKE